MKDGFTTIKRLKTGESVPSSADVDFVRGSDGQVHVSTPSGVQQVATTQSVQQTIGGSVEKVQITTVGYALTPSTEGKRREFHVETGGSLADFSIAGWPLPSAGEVQEFGLQNHTGANLVFVAGSGYTLVTMDGDPTESQTITIPDNTRRIFTVDADGFVQTLAGSEVSRGEFLSALLAKANLAALTDGSITALFDTLRFDRVADISGTDLDSLTISGFYDGNGFGNRPTGTADDWFFVVHLQHSDIVDPVWRTQLVKGLFPATGWYTRSRTNLGWTAWTQLVSNTDIKTVNGQSLIGAGNLTIASSGGQVSPLLTEARYWYSADTYDFVNHSGPNLGAGGQQITGVAGKLPGIASINGRPAWGMYISTTDYRGLTAINQMGTTQAVEIFFVKKMRNVSAIDNLVHWNGGDASRNLTHFPYSDATVYFDAGSSDASGRLTAAGGLANNDVFIGGLAANASYQAIRKNGAVLASDSNIGTMTFTGGLRLGWGVVNGDLAEILVFNRALTQSEREFVEGYLAKKYGVTLTGGHLFA